MCLSLPEPPSQFGTGGPRSEPAVQLRSRPQEGKRGPNGPTWRRVCSGSSLWFQTRTIALLRRRSQIISGEDGEDAARLLAVTPDDPRSGSSFLN